MLQDFFRFGPIAIAVRLEPLPELGQKLLRPAARLQNVDVLLEHVLELVVAVREMLRVLVVYLVVELHLLFVYVGVVRIEPHGLHAALDGDVVDLPALAPRL